MRKALIPVLAAGLAGSAAGAQLPGSTVGDATTSTVDAPGTGARIGTTSTLGTPPPGPRGPATSVGASAQVGVTVPPPRGWTRSQADWSAHVRSCQSRFATYDPVTDTYMSNGARLPCPH